MGQGHSCPPCSRPFSPGLHPHPPRSPVGLRGIHPALTPVQRRPGPHPIREPCVPPHRVRSPPRQAEFCATSRKASWTRNPPLAANPSLCPPHLALLGVCKAALQGAGAGQQVPLHLGTHATPEAPSPPFPGQNRGLAANQGQREEERTAAGRGGKEGPCPSARRHPPWELTDAHGAGPEPLGGTCHPPAPGPLRPLTSHPGASPPRGRPPMPHSSQGRAEGSRDPC